WYGIDVGEEYYKLALRYLEEEGFLKLEGDKIIIEKL
ncbi:MAG: phosphoribosyltransferase, partial [Thermoprotei archaeon]